MLPSVLQPNETDHVPVLGEEVRRLLDVQPGETVVDATFGAGGHAALLARELRGKGKLIAVDRDPTVRPYFERFRRHAGVQARYLRGDFSVVLRQLADNGVRADAILLDLGVSSMQIDRPERGFSYATDAPLDMRMDPVVRLLRARAGQRGVRSASSSRSSGASARSGTRARSRARSGAGGASSRSSGPASSSTRSGRRSRRRRGSARDIPRSASSRRCGSRSTTSSARSRRRCRRRWRCCARAAGWP